MKAGLIFFLHSCLSKKNWQNHRQLAEMEKDIYIKNNNNKKTPVEKSLLQDAWEKENTYLPNGNYCWTNSMGLWCSN